MDSKAFITISTHLYPHDATLAVLKARLDEEGIPFVMQDEHYVAIAPLESLAVGGVKLRTLAMFAPRVRELMQEMSTLPPVAEEDIDPEDAAWMAERLHKERQYRRQFNKWTPIIGGLILVLSLLGLLVKEFFTPVAPAHPSTYSSQTAP